ncbi:hypothetical protein [Sandaracinus amylolyticus]|uniref:hypothetical protein n=1 Tax=Sandaracinus amylolyticus TaxID=927083 RepID=UPI001F2B1C74|nr:hypothetical protein [Sandaracinus amylolyticus]UJR83629.1 Hypothetical protein I5071_56970 [Sandaracinus amylolyticus]
MRMRTSGVVGLALLAAACGGGGEETSRATTPAPTAGATVGTERVVAAQAPGPPRAPTIVEVDESRLPSSTPRISVARVSEVDIQPQPGAQAAMEGETLAAIEEEIAMPAICPSDIESLRVRARNVSRGAAMVLTARGDDDVTRLRDHMRAFALAHSRTHAEQCPDPSHGEMTSAPRHELADPASPILSVHELRLVEIPNGVRVELRHDAGVERASIRELRTRVREDAASLDEGVCPLAFQMT